MVTLNLKLFTLKEKICAWEITHSDKEEYHSGYARPFKKSSSLDTIQPSEFYNIPYPKKMLKAADYIADLKSFFEDAFSACDAIQPYENYDAAIKQTFGPTSLIYKLYSEKALDPTHAANRADLYIDFEAMNMRICGWYAELVDGEETTEYSGIAKPFSDERRMRWLWKTTYQKILPYAFEDIIRSKHIHGYRNYFTELFRRARHIYTYGDTDALFVKYSFGEEMYHFFKVKNVDMSVRLGNRSLSLDKTCNLFGIHIEGEDHDPKNDVLKMRAYMDACKNL